MAKYRVKDWSRNNFPALYKCADDAARRAQRRYVGLVFVDVSLMVLGALVASFGPEDGGTKQTLLVVAAVLFFLGLGTTVLLAFKRWEKIWFAGRAVAESTKSIAWKFVAGADPFPLSIASAEAIERLGGALTELIHDHKELTASLGGPEAIGEQVTAWMQTVRSSATGVRRDVYLAQRVNEQRAWYASNASRNRAQQETWFFGFLIAQVAAAGTTVLVALNPEWTWQPAGVFAALAAAILAWGQVRRYQELAQAYGYAAHELGLISARGDFVGTPDELARFVADAETAISREHTAWVARREAE